MTEAIKEQRATLFESKLIECVSTLRINTVKFVIIMKRIRDEELYKVIGGGYPSFESFCVDSQYDAGMKPSTIKMYIKDLEDLEAKKVEAKNVTDLSMNKIHLIKEAKEPVKWIDDARTMAITDLKEEFYKKEKGVDLGDKGIQNYIKREEKKEIECCPFWKKGKCTK